MNFINYWTAWVRLDRKRWERVGIAHSDVEAARLFDEWDEMKEKIVLPHSIEPNPGHSIW